MPQSLSKVYLHCVFSTKKCELFISDDIQKDLHSLISHKLFRPYRAYMKSISVI